MATQTPTLTNHFLHVLKSKYAQMVLTVFIAFLFSLSAFSFVNSEYFQSNILQKSQISQEEIIKNELEKMMQLELVPNMQKIVEQEIGESFSEITSSEYLEEEVHRAAQKIHSEQINIGK